MGIDKTGEVIGIVNGGKEANIVYSTTIERIGCEYSDDWDPEIALVANSQPGTKVAGPGQHTVEVMLSRWRIEVGSMPSLSPQILGIEKPELAPTAIAI